MVANNYGFSASGAAFGGLITNPTKHSIAVRSRATASLAPTGGISKSKLRHYDAGGVSFRNAETHVEGRADGSPTGEGLFTTTATVSMEDLNVQDVVTADGLRAVITSTRSLRDRESKFTLDAEFVNLRIRGRRVQTALNTRLFAQIPTYADFVSFFAQEKNMRDFGRRFGWMSEDQKVDPKVLAAQFGAKLNEFAVDEPIRCSLLTDDLAGGKIFTQAGYVLHVKDFGDIYVAEVLVKPGRRRLNMLRIETPVKPQVVLDKVKSNARGLAERSEDPDTLSTTYCSGEGNGSPSFP